MTTEDTRFGCSAPKTEHLENTKEELHGTGIISNLDAFMVLKLTKQMPKLKTDELISLQKLVYRFVT